ncbi:TIM barrel protein [Tundrisphaera lichenicola]|uniref:TIM barrel protein n=1 Tax=Tundrisphaera lichenicola TaxID=2029860 RepID=UPI003EB73213
MKFSFLFYDPIDSLEELDRRMGLLASLGYQGIELSASHPPPYSVREIAALVEKHHLPVVSFLTGWSYPNEGLCLSSPDPTNRDRAVHRLVEYVEQAAALKALIVVGLMQGLRSDEPDDETAKNRIADSLRRVAQQAEKVGGSVVIEPVNHLQVGFNNSVAEALAIADRVGSPALGVMLDTFHMHIEERSVVGAIRLHAAQARHVHLCETTGGPFGSGALDFRGVLSALDESGYDRVVSIKVYRQLGWEEAARSSAEYLRGLGFGIFQVPAS